MAEAHAAGRAPRVEQSPLPLQHGLGRMIQRPELVPVEQRRDQPAEVARVALDDLAHRRVAAALRARLGRLVEAGDRLAQARRQIEVQLAPRRHAVQLRLGRKAPHLEQPFDGLAVAVERKPARPRRA